MKYFFTDGGATLNKAELELNYSGYAYVGIDTETNKVFGKYVSCPKGTNNQMEMRAILDVLKTVEFGEEVIIFCDSSYVLNGVVEWSKNWKAKNFADIANADLWREINSQRTLKDTGFIKVKGHSTSKFNNEADRLVGFAREISKRISDKETENFFEREATEEDLIELAKEVNANLAFVRKQAREEMGF